jgi:hypothetical protein
MRTVVIHFDPQQDEQALLIHRLRNFGEDVWRHVRDADWGCVSIDEVDRATTQFAITEVRAKKLRRLTAWLQLQADLQHLRIKMEIV